MDAKMELKKLSDELERTRKSLNKLTEEKPFDIRDMEILELSRKLDVLIVKYVIEKRVANM